MKLKFTPLVISTLLLLAAPQAAFAAGQGQKNIESDNISFPVIPQKGDIHVTVEAFSSESCTQAPRVKSFFLGAGAIIDVAIGLVGSLLENQKDGLQASYSGGLSNTFTAPIKCIKVERKKVQGMNGSEVQYDQTPLMSLELLVDDKGVSGSASRLALKDLKVIEPAPSRSKKKYDTRLNYAVSVAFITVDSAGKERAFSRNLSLIPNVPLIGEFNKGKQVRDTIIYSPKEGERFESPIFADLPTTPYTATITVSITETDKKYKKAEKLSDFFDDNSSIIDSVLGDVFD